MKIFKNVFVSFFFVFLLMNSSWSKSATEFISSITNEASIILSGKLTDEEKIIKLKKIGENSVDIDGVGLYTLGKYRKVLTEDQKKNIKSFLEAIF